MNFRIIMLASLTAGFLALEAHAQSQPVTRTQAELIRIVDQMRALSKEQSDELHKAIESNTAAMRAQERAETSLRESMAQIIYMKNQVEVIRDWGITQQSLKNDALTDLAETEQRLNIEKKNHAQTRGSYLRLKTVAAIVIGIVVGLALIQFAPVLGPYGFLLPIIGGGSAAAILFFLL
jgi:hypothetical protein